MVDIRRGACPLCSHNRIIQAAPVDFSGALAVTPAVTHETSRWAGVRADRPIGLLNIFVCQRCGFTQWFAYTPEAIPIGDEYGTRLIVGPEPSGPYR